MQHKTQKRLLGQRYFAILFLALLIGVFGLDLASSAEQNKAAHELHRGIEHFTNLLDKEYRKRKLLTIPIFLYHYVENVKDTRDIIRKSLAVSPTVFASQIETLLANGYTPITFDRVFAYYDRGVELPQKPVILSFDDGYRDFYTDVFPLLTKYGVSAVLYVVPGFLDTTENYLTTAQFKEIAKSDLVQIGAHTLHHADLVTLTLPEAKAEIVKSKQILAELTGKTIFDFAYPYGKYTESIEKIVEEEGFRSAVTVNEGKEHAYTNRFEWKRMRAGQNVGGELISVIEKVTDQGIVTR